MYYACMAVALQIRNVPDEVRDALVERASQLGQSMQAFLLDLVQREARLARNANMFQRTAGSRTVIPDEFSPERIIREGRDAGFDTDRNGALGAR
jgi:plasmid stability protein